ncbi:MAG TPA: hypothetical protein DCY79_17060 [Planctomycetaceae bacterium]|nr:hypothetical protein [Blastopirellula sp.]HAY81516.1 hypothetical protein [Planctomycetaceae bacterium]
MSHLLLTGATGLLGGYLLRDCARHNLELAVVVRSSKRESARQRIESILAGWENQLGYSLPRPVVLEGDLTKPGLGLDTSQRTWIRDHCSGVIHNAASLTFVKTKDGEPFRSNVEGTRHVLELTRDAGIRKFHHVSTAYICGLRTGRVLETELNVGQQLGNVYEESKIESEAMVMEADYLDRPTVFRPGIIIGDSETGFTSTFHGFYSPLRVAFALVDRIAAGDEAGAQYGLQLLSLFQLQGDEQKNFVPVDWVSAFMAAALANPELHGQVYHLTPANAVTITEMTSVMMEVVDTHVQAHPVEANGRSISRSSFEQFFRDQLAVYKSYWRNDPVFDRTNTMAALPDLPCPIVDRDMLIRMCHFAVKARFGSPAPAPIIPKFDVHAHLASRTTATRELNNSAEASTASHIGLRVTGAGGGDWELELRRDRLVAAHPGVMDDTDTLLYLNSHTFQNLVENGTSPEQCLRTGQILIEGKSPCLQETISLIEQVTGKSHQRA